MLAVAVLFPVPAASLASPCLAPDRPFLPSDSQAVRAYKEILRKDFESYIQNIEAYFRCLEDERQRAFLEARQVNEENVRFIQLVVE